ncbi:hypothetical protein Lal_00020175 [Lupinus albus]|uniref:Putative leucine-rich repeat domain, L domain-containing protein n=1 Tax=Lupinus albus TaxID=3870 RepID=A0A6A4Q523_LUPAL|nr:putative leucine-rich repeat domain, L domain-containing protein [Lupinus albus]KAF1871382.1 hypothetical protein Lal_00020175 [Lupinus albus]
MAGIPTLDELMRRMEEAKKTKKVPPNWLDRLRAKKGVPTGNNPDLGTFLLSQANTNPPIPHFQENSQNLPHPSIPSTSTAAEEKLQQQQEIVVVVADPVAPADLVAPADPVAPAEGDHHQEGDPQVHRIERPPRFPMQVIQPALQQMEEEEDEEEEDDEDEEEEEEVEHSDITELDGITHAQLVFHDQLNEGSESSVNG